MTELEFDEIGQVEVDGKRIRVLRLGNCLSRGPTDIKVAIVAETVEELTSPEAFLEATRIMLESVARRAITPAGFWVTGTLPVDWPLWREYLAPAVAAQVAAKLRETGGHVQVYALLDTATMEPER